MSAELMKPGVESWDFAQQGNLLTDVGQQECVYISLCFHKAKELVGVIGRHQSKGQENSSDK